MVQLKVAVAIEKIGQENIIQNMDFEEQDYIGFGLV